MTPLAPALGALARDLDGLGANWALIGGLALGVRAVPRTTVDIDVIIAVADDETAEGHIRSLLARGYALVRSHEDELTGRLAMVRLERGGVVVDVMLAWTGIEADVVAGATRLQVTGSCAAPVASTGHLIALKVLAGRRQDLADVVSLRRHATEEDLAVARLALERIDALGLARGKDLAAELARLLAEPLERD